MPAVNCWSCGRFAREDEECDNCEAFNRGESDFNEDETDTEDGCWCPCPCDPCDSHDCCNCHGIHD